MKVANTLKHVRFHNDNCNTANYDLIKKIVIGSWSFSGNLGETNSKASHEAITYSIENNIKYFDTAPVYGDGKVDMTDFNIFLNCMTYDGSNILDFCKDKEVFCLLCEHLGEASPCNGDCLECI